MNPIHKSNRINFISNQINRLRRHSSYCLKCKRKDDCQVHNTLLQAVRDTQSRYTTSDKSTKVDTKHLRVVK